MSKITEKYVPEIYKIIIRALAKTAKIQSGLKVKEINVKEN